MVTTMPDREINDLSINNYRIGILDPMQTTQGNCMALCVVTGHLVAAL